MPGNWTKQVIEQALERRAELHLDPFRRSILAKRAKKLAMDFLRDPSLGAADQFLLELNDLKIVLTDKQSKIVYGLNLDRVTNETAERIAIRRAAKLLPILEDIIDETGSYSVSGQFRKWRVRFMCGGLIVLCMFPPMLLREYGYNFLEHTGRNPQGEFFAVHHHFIFGDFARYGSVEVGHFLVMGLAWCLAVWHFPKVRRLKPATAAEKAKMAATAAEIIPPQYR